MKSVVLLSGGMDSTTLLADRVANGDEVSALSVFYGQRHKKELERAKQIAAHYSVPHRVADLSSIQPLLGGSALTDPSIAVPHGHYAEDSMKITVVPNRNMIMLSVAIGWAVALEAEKVFFAAHAGDHSIYPDCRKEFVQAMSHVARIANYHSVVVWAPFLEMGKHDIAKLGHRLNVPWELTWSCYEGGRDHCGACGTCVERKEAFELAGIIDPTIYSSPEAGVGASAGASAGAPA
jgi:7-cyano-7-deazaguanine synthase